MRSYTVYFGLSLDASNPDLGAADKDGVVLNVSAFPLRVNGHEIEIPVHALKATKADFIKYVCSKAGELYDMAERYLP